MKMVQKNNVLEGLLEKKQVVVFVLQPQDYLKKLIEINRILEKSSKKICYVSMNLPAGRINKLLEDEEINLNKYFFVRFRQESESGSESSPQEVYIASPTALIAFKLTISGILSNPNSPDKYYNTPEEKADALLFDSISSLLKYNSEVDSMKLLNCLMDKNRLTGTKGVYLILSEDYSGLTAQTLPLIADQVVIV
jgi:hypothetical protein